MNPLYSVLFFHEELSEYYDRIEVWLKKGIRIFWFGSDAEIGRLKSAFGSFADAFFLQAFSLEQIPNHERLVKMVIVDGQGITEDPMKCNVLDWLDAHLPAFNVAQYRVEHCREEENIVVKASAGTGKTTVMIDRILYLMHTVPGLNMSDIYMITFTNEAANQMNDRLQAMLLKKYSLTKNQKYLTWLEQQSQMHISTIDSLAYDLFRRFGAGVGFGRDLRIQPLEKERKTIIKDLLSEELSERRSIFAQVGMSYSQAARLIDDYWKEITRKGYTIREILDRDWGNGGTDQAAANFQRIFKAVLEQFEEQYRQVKMDSNAISINDLFFDFGHYLLDERLDCGGLEMKYLFVDEFQDTDATQIRTFARLVQKLGAGLFAVGDAKQSIYGFKGATDEAFEILDEAMGGNVTYYSLRNNYRTCKNLMEIMEQYFFAWSREGLLRYEEGVRPFNPDRGVVEMEYIENKNSIPTQTVEAIRLALMDLEEDILSGYKKVSEKTKVAVLVRGNPKAAEIAEWCRLGGMTVVLNSDSPFFLSRAVRDFYAMISSFLFPDQPLYLYQYFMTPYADLNGELSLTEMERLEGDKEALNAYLHQFPAYDTWQSYQKKFRLKPVLSVIKDMVNQESLIERFIAMDKGNMTGDRWTEAKKNKQALIDAKRYRMNLDKLMEMIRQRTNGEFTSLYDIYVYLSLMIAANREEMEPDIDMVDDYTSVYIMTVHKSKGLEFDTVVMPAMNGRLIPGERTGILINDRKAAWCYRKDASSQMSSTWYQELREEAIRKGIEEETRMLYVAMTRAVNKLVMLVNDWTMYESWSSLIRKVGLINE